MTVDILIILAGFGLLFYGAHFLIEGSVSLARKMRISDIIIGFTIVAFGTSAPEFIVGVMASIQGQGDITVGNVIGSNLFNLLLVLGITGIIVPLSVDIKAVKRYIPFSVIALLALVAAGNDSIFNRANILSRTDGLILLGLFIMYILYCIRESKALPVPEEDVKQRGMVMSIILFVLGVAMLSFGGDITTSSAVSIAKRMNVSEKLIAITIIATGTSLPELITSIVAVSKQKHDIAVGNIIGSNIFNIFLILGASALIKPLTFNSALNVDIIYLFISTVIMVIMVLLSRKYILNRISAFIMLLMFSAYWAFVIIRH